MRKKKYILFDHDGVLVDTEYWYFMSNKKALSELGISLDKDQYLEDMSKGISCWDWVRSMDFDETIIAEKRARRNLYYQKYLKEKDTEITGVEGSLSKLSKGYRMAIVTTSKRSDFNLIHKDRNITKFMEFVLTLEDYKNAKPHPEPYLKGIQLFGGEKEEVLAVEDSERGLKSAVAAEIDCVIVHNEFTKTQDFSEATCHIKSIYELPKLIESL